jgi:hypothetical protein
MFRPRSCSFTLGNPLCGRQGGGPRVFLLHSLSEPLVAATRAGSTSTGLSIVGRRCACRAPINLPEGGLTGRDLISRKHARGAHARHYRPKSAGYASSRAAPAVQRGHRHSPTGTDSRLVRDKCADTDCRVRSHSADQHKRARLRKRRKSRPQRESFSMLMPFQCSSPRWGARSREHIAAIHRRMLSVFDLDPVLAAAATIGPIAMLGD